MGAAALRNATLALPLLLVALAAGWRVRSGDLAGRVPAAVLATLLAWVGVVAVESAGSWWTVAPGPTTVLGLPLETSLGWALAWGALPVLAGGRVLLWWAGFLWVDVLVVPRLDPLVRLGEHWLLGEALLLVLVAAPALALGRLTVSRRHLPTRVVLQVVTFTGLFGWAAPTLALAADGLGWADVVDHGLVGRTLLLVAAVGVGVPVLAAVAELARVGRGTPFPWDPPDRLVTSGPYAYVRNPMQSGMCLLLVLLAVAAGSWTLGLGVLVAATFALAVAEPHEHATLAVRWPGYPSYRRAVRPWVPRWTPVADDPATLWVSETCGLCRATGHTVEGLRPSGVRLRPAESAPVVLTRMRWCAGDTDDRGVAALARALERTRLPWAWVGWLVRLPVLGTGVQVVADACGLGPRVLPAEPGESWA
ncbi:hypothetical protein JQN72_01055 [Phycicoccus sp. CSK15P-2]|uniref:methyltransferase family protein n=1 Tax=Phycicoccus sp. CSK15P-2 TaxID=2807627 RepID=UPI00194DC5D4|nr:methyltransferase [Phycicoccus sp. CSK15P-2]MBM6402833.1 hypothetical protein [Phycicoccus sp. CSK15P-2]